jgi:hypothetical protein
VQILLTKNKDLVTLAVLWYAVFLENQETKLVNIVKTLYTSKFSINFENIHNILDAIGFLQEKGEN